MPQKPEVPLSTIERIPTYIRVAKSLISHDIELAPSSLLATRAGVSAAQFRKDMSLLGASSGTRGAGYSLKGLVEEFRAALGGTQRVRFVIVGAGNLGSALASSTAFRRDGLELVGMFDTDSAKVGSEIAGVIVRHDDALASFIEAEHVSIVVIATPELAAQSVADRATASGARQLLNFSPKVLHVAGDVEVRTVDLGVELQLLAFHARHES